MLMSTIYKALSKFNNNKHIKQLHLKMDQEDEQTLPCGRLEIEDRAYEKVLLITHDW